MSLISVVVPVYNVEDYLDWCLESLYSQSLRDIEIVCVNDGSTDSSREKLDEWSKKDSRIVIVDKPNGGLSSARNAGIRSASSKYVCFLDSDDRFHSDTCEKIVSFMERNDADVLTFGACCYPAESSYPWLEQVLSPRDAVYDSFSLDILFKENSRPFSWRTACRRDFLIDNGICFDEELRFGEDQLFDFAIYPRAKKTVLSSEKLYDYRVAREGSLMDKVKSDFALKMSKHVDIVNHIFADWARGGFLHEYAPEMLSFALDFSLYDALKLESADYLRVADQLKAVCERYWSRSDVEEMPLDPVMRDIALRACYSPMMSSLGRKKLALRLYASKYGKRAALHEIVNKLTH